MEEYIKQPKVNIILAVYNGEKYLKKQLDSLLEQTYENIDIYIRDDGSTDGTVDFLKEYIGKNESQKRVILMDGRGENLGCPESFYEIIRGCDKADYYALCDQDDCWYPNKVAWAVERLEQEDKNEILLYYTASDYLTSDGTFIRKSPSQKERIGLKDVLYYTPGSGFTIVFNEMTRKKLVLDAKPGPELHDRWLIRGAACFGTVIYDERSSAAHIRHQEAVTAGDSDSKNLLKHFWQNELCGEDAKREKEALYYFFRKFHKELSPRECRALWLFAKEKCTPIDWFTKVFYPYRLRRRLFGELALRLLFILGRI